MPVKRERAILPSFTLAGFTLHCQCQHYSNIGSIVWRAEVWTCQCLNATHFRPVWTCSNIGMFKLRPFRLYCQCLNSVDVGMWGVSNFGTIQTLAADLWTGIANIMVRLYAPEETKVRNRQTWCKVRLLNGTMNYNNESEKMKIIW